MEILIDTIGWIAMACTMSSFLFTNMRKLRIINLIGCVIWIGYSLTMEKPLPILITNLFIGFTHARWFYLQWAENHKVNWKHIINKKHLMVLAILSMSIQSCSTQDPCVRLNEWNYTKEWYHRKEQRFQVYKTWRGNRFIYDYNIDSTGFRRVYIKNEK